MIRMTRSISITLGERYTHLDSRETEQRSWLHELDDLGEIRHCGSGIVAAREVC